MGRILVVDDDPDILRMAEHLLVSAGHTVFCAEDALRAIDWLNHFEFDLLLSDANMPHYSGYDLINTIRNNPKYSHMAVAMLTGMREKKDVERAVKIGVDDYIVKPLDPMLFIQKIQQLFAKKAPIEYAEYNLTTSPYGQATLQQAVEVLSISELGIKVVSELPLLAGNNIKISADIFRVLEIDVPTMKVLRVDQDPKTGKYHAQLIFLGARESMLQKIRRWIYSHGMNAKNAG